MKAVQRSPSTLPARSGDAIAATRCSVQRQRQTSTCSCSASQTPHEGNVLVLDGHRLSKEAKGVHVVQEESLFVGRVCGEDDGSFSAASGSVCLEGGLRHSQVWRCLQPRLSRADSEWKYTTPAAWHIQLALVFSLLAQNSLKHV